MANVLSAIVGTVAGELADLLIREIKLLRGVEDKVEWIGRELRLVHEFLEEGNEGLGKDVVKWAEEARDVAQEAKQAIDDIILKSERRRRRWIFKMYVLILNDLIDRHELRKELQRVKIKIDSISSRRQEFIKKKEESDSMFQSRPSIAQKHDIIGRRDDVEQLKRRLLDDDERDISIVGMGGIGKTTLAKLIYDDDAIVDHFPCRVWVSIPREYSDGAIRRYIWKQVMEQLGEQQIVEEESMQMLRAFLIKKRYLLVLDNVWTAEVSVSLKEAFPDGSKGSKLLITTRNKAVASDVSPKALFYEMRLLTEAESWTLFKRSLKKELIPLELEMLGREIVKRCAGLPLAILKIGNLLSQNDATIKEWSRMLHNFNQYERPLLKTLGVITKDFPFYLRRCLFYFSLFPADLDVPARRLIALWVAEGLVYHSGENTEPPENIAEGYLTKLIDQHVVRVTKKKINGKVKTCRLNDAVRELTLSTAEETAFIQSRTNINFKLSPRTGMIHRLADHLNEKDAGFDHIHNNNMNTPLRLDYRYVVSFLSFDSREGSKPGEDIQHFLHRCISKGSFLMLRVLDLEGVFRPKLPKALGKLTSLSYLGLRWTYLEMLPSFISNLLNLQTLDLKHTYINSLPNSIWKMKKLRHLFLSESYRSRFVPRPRGSSLKDLQTLWGVFVDEESPVRDGLDRLLNLRKLGLACRLMLSQQDAMSSQLNAVADWIQKLEHLQSLRLRSNDERGQPWHLRFKSFSGNKNLSTIYLLGRLKYPSVISKFPESLIDLTLSASGLKEDPMQELKKLPNLKILRLFSNSYTKKKMVCSSEGFPQLQVLQLWKLEELEEWNVEEGALPELRDLEIRSCTSLKVLPDRLRDIRTLQELKLTNMPEEFTARIEKNQGPDWYKIEQIPVVNIDKW